MALSFRRAGFSGEEKSLSAAGGSLLIRGLGFLSRKGRSLEMTQDGIVISTSRLFRRGEIFVGRWWVAAYPGTRISQSQRALPRNDTGWHCHFDEPAFPARRNLCRPLVGRCLSGD